jgi:hypothetical protein
VRKVALGLWTAQVLVAIGMLVAACVEIETIVGTGPVLTVTGLALAIVTRRLNSWEPIAFGLSGPLICALTATLTAVYRWGPHDAERPVPVLFSAYLVAASPLAFLAFRAILRWQPLVWSHEKRVWQFSLRSLLVWMTVICVLVAAGQYVVLENADAPSRPHREGLVFALFAASAMLLSATILWRFLAKRRHPK